MILQNFLRGEDIAVLLQEVPLGGVTGMTVREKITYYDIREYAAGEPFERIPLHKEYEIELKRYFTEEDPFELLSDFTLTVRAGCKVMRYESCFTESQSYEMTAEKGLITVTKIKAYTGSREAL